MNNNYSHSTTRHKITTQEEHPIHHFHCRIVSCKLQIITKLTNHDQNMKLNTICTELHKK